MKKMMFGFIFSSLIVSGAHARIIRIPDPFDWFGETARDLSYEFIGPRMDIISEKDKYIVKVEAPGYEKEDFNITVQPRRIIITAEKKRKTEEKKDQHYLRKEISYKSFRREETLREMVKTNPKLIDAKYENGILIVTIPKEERTVRKGTKIFVK